MSMTLTEKLLARAAGQARVAPGDNVLADKRVYTGRDPEVGEVVIFRNPENRKQFLPI